MVLCDINMPRMDGLTLLGRLQERDDHLATVIVSAYGDMVNIRTAMNRGAFDFITKPIDFADLEKTIAKTLRHPILVYPWLGAERARAQLARYFSPSLVEMLAAEADDIDLGAQRRDITAMFTDVTNFTSLVERLAPATIGPLLHDYFAGMTEIVFDHGGALVNHRRQDEYPVRRSADQPDHAERAVPAPGTGRACREDSGALAPRASRSARPASGIHAGPALVGNFGGGGSSTTRPMATPSTSPHGSKRPTSNSARASASAAAWWSVSPASAAVRSEACCCAAGAGPCRRTNR
jgi:adenylate cyclase